MSGGFGISGHKNSYSTGIKCGNWVEDTIGMDLISCPRARADPPTSESRSCFKRPQTIQSGPEFQVTDARSGLPYHVLFGHGREEAIDPAAGKHNLTTTCQLAFKPATEACVKLTDLIDPPRGCSEPNEAPRNTLTRTKQKIHERERKENPFKTTCQQQLGHTVASITCNPSHLKASKTTGTARSANFTRTFKQDIPQLRK